MPDLLLELFSEEIPARMRPCAHSEARTHKQEYEAMQLGTINYA